MLLIRKFFPQRYKVCLAHHENKTLKSHLPVIIWATWLKIKIALIVQPATHPHFILPYFLYSLAICVSTGIEIVHVPITLTHFAIPKAPKNFYRFFKQAQKKRMMLRQDQTALLVKAPHCAV